jgi:hypothetical protein
VDQALTSSPPAGPETLDTNAAGHGTFIVALLARLLPQTQIYAARVAPRFAADDFFEHPSNGTVVTVRDDFSLTWTLMSLPSEMNYVNLSLGTYGCAEQTDSVGDGAFRSPLGVRRAIEVVTSSGTLVFAATGNDEHREDRADPAFFPAAWAREFEGLFSVASDQLNGIDYSNRGGYVEHQARGSRTVSILPSTNTWGAPGWYAWSGTSFATPCAIVGHISNQLVQVSNPSRPSPNEQFDCMVNL